MRGRVISALKEYDELPLSKLGPRVRVDYVPGGDGSSGESAEYGREWLRGLIDDLEDDGLVETVEADGETVARLQR
jgi:A/G-specific adenine glycosylase